MATEISVNSLAVLTMWTLWHFKMQSGERLAVGLETLFSCFFSYDDICNWVQIPMNLKNISPLFKINRLPSSKREAIIQNNGDKSTDVYTQPSQIEWTYLSLRNMAVITQMYFPNSFHELMIWALPVNLVVGECLSPVRCQAITWTNADLLSITPSK